MLRMDQVYVIRHKVLVERRSVRQVARELGLSRNTVAKYLAQSEPLSAARRQRQRPVWDRVKARLEELLAEWEARSWGKQQLTGTRLHRQLAAEGYQVGTTLLRQHLRERRRRKAEVFVPLIHRAGDEAQIDFFEVVVELGGEWLKVWEFLLRLMYSGREFAWLYQRCDQLSFLDGHVRAFSYLGGVPRRCIYDNLGSAVRRIVGSQRELSGRFAALASHYLFEPCFARVGEGHDKGGVESRGRAIRHQHLTPIPRGPNLGEISAALLAEIEGAFAAHRTAEGRRATDLWSEEQRELRPLPSAAFEVSRMVPVEISSRALVKVEGAWYSVPSRWARLRATAYVGVDQIRIVCMDESVSHPRAGFGARRVRYRHYLPELARKPQAVRQVAAELIGELGEPWDRIWKLLVETHGEREAARVLARLLGAIGEHGEERVREALRAALSARRLNLLDLISATAAAPQQIAVPQSLSSYVIEAGRAADYDHLLAEGGRHD